MTIKPWREVAQPHKDVLEGTFKQSEFAADISQVHAGKATPEYQDAEKFFARTFITEGMGLLLESVAERLARKGGDPVIQLQTAFGGGKTHTLLAVYHLANRQCPTSDLAGIPPILDKLGIDSLPNSRVAVIDGNQLSPSQARSVDGITTNTLWGELAAQLLGNDGYALVEASDTNGTSPGKDVLADLLDKASPCVILIDELVAYIRQFEPGKQFRGGTFDSNLSFIQALTEAVKTVPDAILLASLPESDVEIGGDLGKRALLALEKYFGRVESVWKPVAAVEAFEIVRRRLFDTVADENTIKEVARDFGAYYRQHAGKFPAETQEARYEERIYQSYPIHPEIFDRLYEDWSTLSKFQRTRGVLQYMAIVIHRLWNANDKDPLIMPGSLPLGDVTVRNKSIHYLPTGWEPVLEREIDGPDSETVEIDGRDTRYGSVQAARRVARTIFLGSAPSASEQHARGIKVERILLGAAQPGQIPGVYEDVLKRLRDRLHYLYGEGDSYWFDTRPNLRREMESRKQNIDYKEDVLPVLQQGVSRIFGKQHSFAGIHVFTRSADVPDEFGSGPRLVVLPPDASYHKADQSPALDAAEEILRNRGEQPRLKQNRLIFLAPDASNANLMKDQTRTLLAWQSIITDVENSRMDMGVYQVTQAKRHLDEAEKGLTQHIRETYKWLFCPAEEHIKGKTKFRWDTVAVSPSAPNLVQAIEDKLKEEEWVIYEWSPIHLRNVLQQWYLKDGVSEVEAMKVWRDTCQYLYLPRLLNDRVFRAAITQGLQDEDYFGFASGKEESDYLGFRFGTDSGSVVDEESLLIDRDMAKVHAEKIRQAEQPSLQQGQPDETGSWNATLPLGPENPEAPDSPEPGNIRKHFYATVTLDPIKAKMDFAEIMNEVVEHFTAKLGVNVTISVEIEASNREGFDQAIQRTVKENCNTLKFSTAEFEESE